MSTKTLSIQPKYNKLQYFPERPYRTTWNSDILTVVSDKASKIKFWAQSLFNRVVSVHETVKPMNGYHYEMQELTQAQLKPHLKYIALAAYANVSVLDEFIKPFGYNSLHPDQLNLNLNSLPGCIQVKEGQKLKDGEQIQTEHCFMDCQTGLKVTVAVNPQTQEIILGYGAAKSFQCELHDNEAGYKETIKIQEKEAIRALKGGQSQLFDQADQLTKAIIDQINKNPEYKGFSCKLVGICLGGSIAQYIALKQGLEARCCNTLPLGSGLQNNIIAARGQQALENADNNVIHVSARTDWISDLIGAGFWVKFLSCLGLRTPGNFGQRYCIPTAYPGIRNFGQTHRYILGSAMNYLGMGKRALPKDLVLKVPDLFRG